MAVTESIKYLSLFINLFPEHEKNNHHLENKSLSIQLRICICKNTYFENSNKTIITPSNEYNSSTNNQSNTRIHLALLERDNKITLICL